MQTRLPLLLDNAYELARSLVELATLPLAFARTFLRSQRELAAENLFLRRQMGYLIEHGAKPRRLSNGTRVALVWLSRLFDWKDAIAIVKPQTLVRWHRQGYRLLWRWKSRPRGRPPIPMEAHRSDGDGERLGRGADRVGASPEDRNQGFATDRP